MSVWLFIDTHKRGTSRLGWLSVHAGASVHSYRGRPAIVLRQLLVHARERLNQCQGICVVLGPGQFSAIRLGVLQANLLARLLGLPLVGIKLDDIEPINGLANRLVTMSPSQYAAPIYDQEPNITLPNSVPRV